MAVRATRVTVGASPIAFGGVDGDGVLGSSIVLRNRSTTVPVFIGGPTVTVNDGFQVDAGESFTAESREKDVYYAVSSGTAICHILEVGV